MEIVINFAIVIFVLFMLLVPILGALNLPKMYNNDDKKIYDFYIQKKLLEASERWDLDHNRR